jgi:hypothetical protein
MVPKVRERLTKHINQQCKSLTRTDLILKKLNDIKLKKSNRLKSEIGLQLWKTWRIELISVGFGKILDRIQKH